MSNVKSVKNLSLASLLLFLGAFTLTPGPIRLAKTLWNIEAYSLVTALSSSEWPDGASIPSLEAAFEFAPMMAPRRGLAVEVIRDHYAEEAVLEGQLLLPFGERAAFRYYPERSNSSFAERRKSYREYEKLYAGTNKVNYAEYDIASLAFPGKWHEVLLADGYVYWTGVENKVAQEWTVVGDEPPLFIKVDEIKQKILKDAIPWAGFEKDYSRSYYEVVKSYRGQELTLPVVGAKIPWSIAGVGFVIVALYLSVLFVHSMLRLRDHGVDRDEPWLLVEPCRPRGRLERMFFGSMIVLGGITLVLFMLLPTATIALVRTTIPNWVFVTSLGTTALLALVGLRELLGIAKRGEFRHREAQRDHGPQDGG